MSAGKLIRAARKSWRLTQQARGRRADPIWHSADSSSSTTTSAQNAAPCVSRSRSPNPKRPAVGSGQWDSAIAALVAHHLSADHLPVPDWATRSERSLSRRWVLGEGPYTLAPDPDRVPPEFARRGVLIDEDTLASA